MVRPAQRFALPPGFPLVDAHEDIACHCQEQHRGLIDPAGVPCMITLPWLLEAGVRIIFATLFVPHEYPLEVRQAKLEDQYRLYESWLAAYPQALRLLRDQSDLQELLKAERQDSEAGSGYPVGIVFLMEGCDLLESAAEMRHWRARGLCVAGLTWNGVNRFATGCFAGGGGISAEGRELLGVMHELGMALDLSHLADQGAWEALECFAGPVCATHSNFRAICNHERNLTAELVAALGRRKGVIGLNLLATFIRTGWIQGLPLPSIEDAIAHTVQIAEIAGWDCVGIGSDLDGGLTPANTPAGIDRVQDLHKLLAALLDNGIPGEAVAGFAGSNWRRFLERVLPK